MIIAHNISAINTYNSLGISTTGTNRAMEKLSSGFRINKAADDAAGLSISEKMRSQIRGLNKASENAENGISLIQTAEGALNEVHSILQRARELAVQSATDTNAPEDREALEQELKQLFSEIDRIGETTEFNGRRILYAEHEFEPKPGYAGSLEGTKAVLSSAFETGYMNETFTIGQFQNVYYTNSEKYSTIKGASVDFSNVTSAADVEELKGKGFSATCNTCLAYVCIQFVDGTGAKLTPVEGVEFGDPKLTGDKEATDLSCVFEVGIDGCTSGSDVVKRVMEAAIKVNQKMVGGSETTPVDMSEFGLATDQTYHNLNFAYQDTSLGYRVTSGWCFAKEGTTTVDPHLERHMLCWAAEYNDGTYGDKIIVSDPRFNGAEPAGFSTDDGANYKAAIKTGVYGNRIECNTLYEELYLHVGANSNQTIYMQLPSISLYDLELGKYDFKTGEFTELDILTRKSANDAIVSIDKAIKSVSNTRSTLGALQNRLEYTINNLHTTAENMTAAESTIRDVDMAEEMMELTKNNILQQAAQAMLVQANARPQQALQLLQ